MIREEKKLKKKKDEIDSENIQKLYVLSLSSH